MINRVVVVAIRASGGAEDDGAAGGAYVHALQREVAQGVVAGLIDEAHRHAAGAGVGDGQLLRRADAAGAAINGEELRAIQIHRCRRGVRAGDAQPNRAARRAQGERVRGGGGESGEDERERFHRADVRGLQLQHERPAERLRLHIGDGRSDARVVAGGADGPGAGERGGEQGGRMKDECRKQQENEGSETVLHGIWGNSCRTRIEHPGVRLIPFLNMFKSRMADRSQLVPVSTAGTGCVTFCGRLFSRRV